MQSNFDEVELRIDSKKLTLNQKFKTCADVVVVLMKIKHTMKHCVMFRRSTPHKSKPELDQWFYFKHLMKELADFELKSLNLILTCRCEDVFLSFVKRTM